VKRRSYNWRKFMEAWQRKEQLRRSGKRHKIMQSSSKLTLLGEP
jgi:hypothetical protein